MSYTRRPIAANIAVYWFYAITTTNLVTGFSPAQYYASPPKTPIISHNNNQQQDYTNKRSSSKTSLQLFPVDQSAAILLAEGVESWREYVPLGVSLLVITDILLGNPIANLALAPMRKATLGDDDDDSDGDSTTPKKKKFVKNPNERVDTDALGAAAVQKARYSMDLRTFLEENKSDEDKYEDMRKKINAQAQEFDSKKKPSD